MQCKSHLPPLTHSHPAVASSPATKITNVYIFTQNSPTISPVRPKPRPSNYVVRELVNKSEWVKTYILTMCMFRDSARLSEAPTSGESTGKGVMGEGDFCFLFRRFFSFL